MKPEKRVIIILLIVVTVYAGVGVYMAFKFDVSQATNVALTTDLEAHALSVVALDKDLELHETSVWGLEQALDIVIGDLNDCIEANK